MSIQIEGALERDGRYYRNVHDHALLFLQVRAGLGFPIEVVHSFGKDAQAHIAAHVTAASARKGDMCRATGTRLLPRTDHGDAVNVLDKLTALRVGERVIL